MIRFLEKIAADAFVGLEEILYDGWELRFTQGFTGRANSVQIREASTIELPKKVAFCEKAYARHDLPCMFKLTDADGELISYLEQRGYRVTKPTDVMLLALDQTDAGCDAQEVSAGVYFSATPEGWFESYFAFENMQDKTKQELTKKIHAKVAVDQVYIRVMHEEKVAAVASLAIESGYSLLHNVVVSPNLRGIGLYRFVFEDNGIGMMKEYLEHIFEPFSRANDIKSAGVQGTGLGMAITRNIVQMMSGDIHVESTYGVGSKFTVTLYLRIDDEKAFDSSGFDGLHVLVADDDPKSCESACGVLNDLGMNSEWVLSGHSAVERVQLRREQGRDFSAVIIDWKMPGMDGIETTRRIRQAVGEGLPIIILSAFDWTDIEQEAREAGASYFISKPLFRTKLARVFNSILNGNAASEDAADPFKKLEELSFENRRVLLAEDNPINAEIAINILDMTGLEVDHAENGQAAVERFKKAPEGHYSMIFMDIQMPVLDGYAASKAIRVLDRPDAKTVPIVAMTANAFDDDKQNALKAGMNGHISKPLNFDELAAVLTKYVK